MMIYEIKGQKQTQASADCVLSVARNAIVNKLGRIQSETASTLEFTTPLLQFNWNIFAPVSRGIVSVETKDGRAVLSYRLSLFRVRLFATLFSLAAIAMAVFLSELGVFVYFIYMALLLAWGWLYGMNFLITSARASSFFAHLLSSLEPEPSRMPVVREIESPSKVRHKRGWALALIFAGVVLVLSVGAFCVYLMFMRGNTFGPSLIEDLLNKQVDATSVASLEIIEPTVGYTPFDEREYKRLVRRKTISDPKEISEFLLALKRYSTPGYVSQNHPSQVYESYIKLNLLSGDFYYLYLDAHQDQTSLVISVEANSKNSTNPNGSTSYHNDSLKPFILKHDGNNFDG